MQKIFAKLFKYRTAGVREYWIVDLEKDRIFIYNFDSEDTGDYTFSDRVKAGNYEDCYIDFSDIAIFLNINTMLNLTYLAVLEPGSDGSYSIFFPIFPDF